MSWDFIELGKIIELQNGYAFNSSQYIESGYFVMRITNVQQGYISTHNPKYISFTNDEKINQYVLNEGDILISLTGDVGRVGEVKGSHLPAVLNQRVARVFIKSEANVCKNFLFILLNSRIFQGQVESISHGAAQLNASTKDILKIKIPIPPLKTQQKIVEKLDAVFAEIDKAIVAAETNIKNAEALFQSYLQKVFEHSNESWVSKTILDVADLVDSLHQTPKYAESGYPMVRVTDIKVGPLILDNAKRVDEATFIEFSKRHKPKIGDIVFSRVGSYGVSSYVDSDDDFCLGQNTVFIIPKINSRFLYYFLNSPAAKKQYDSLKDGVTQPTISLKSIKSVNLKVPSDEIQKNAAIKIDSMYSLKNKMIGVYSTKLKDLMQFKKSLLQQAFFGNLVED